MYLAETNYFHITILRGATKAEFRITMQNSTSEKTQRAPLLDLKHRVNVSASQLPAGPQIQFTLNCVY